MEYLIKITDQKAHRKRDYKPLDTKDIPQEVMDKMMTVKAYLGYKEEFIAQTEAVTSWLTSLSQSDRQAIMNQVAQKGSPSQRKIFQSIL